jgi:hypothetical protein
MNENDSNRITLNDHDQISTLPPATRSRPSHSEWSRSPYTDNHRRGLCRCS